MSSSSSSSSFSSSGSSNSTSSSHDGLQERLNSQTPSVRPDYSQGLFDTGANARPAPVQTADQQPFHAVGMVARRRELLQDTVAKNRQTTNQRVDNINAMTQPCCGNNCRAQFTTASLKATIEKFLSMSRKRRSKFIFDSLFDDKVGGHLIQCVDGAPVCVKLFRMIYKVSHSLFYGLKNAKKQGGTSPPKRATRSSDLTKSSSVAWWLTKQFDHEEFMPHKNEIHISYPDKVSAYEAFLVDARTHGRFVVSKSFFNKVWRESFSYIKCRKPHGFAICKTCVELDDDVRNATTPDVLENLLRLKRAHRKFYQGERLVYNNIVENARHRPDESVSIVIDGADQSCYSLPHFYERSKEVDKGKPYGAKLQGVIVHGLRSYAFMVPMNGNAGSNLTIETLHRVLVDLYGDGSRNIPPTLYLQLDNTTGQNKNNYILGYLQFLAGTIFNTVQLSFLPVGHTHCDVDQMFKVFKGELKKVDALSRQEFLYRLQRVYDPTPKVALLDVQANWTAWLDTIEGGDFCK